MKSILKKIASLFEMPSPAASFYEYNIKCKNCGELVNIKAFPDRDLCPTYDDSGPAYTLNKDVMDSKCFRMMKLTVEFDSSKRELNKEITGGEFVSVDS